MRRRQAVGAAVVGHFVQAPVALGALVAQIRADAAQGVGGERAAEKAHGHLVGGLAQALDEIGALQFAEGEAQGEAVAFVVGAEQPGHAELGQGDDIAVGGGAQLTVDLLDDFGRQGLVVDEPFAGAAVA